MGGERKRRGIFPRFGVSEDVEREIEAHIALHVEELVGAGWDPRAAREEALRRFGDRDRIAAAAAAVTRRHHRAVGRMEMFDTLWQDIRYGVRTLVRSPTFALVAVLTLALGIGANTAIFSVVNGVLLRPLPFEDPDEIVWVTEVNTRGGPMAVAWPNFRDWMANLRSFSGLAAYGVLSTTALGGDEPVQARVGRVSHDYWSIFGVVPVRGRLTTPDDHHEDAAPVVVVSRSFWENELSGAEISGLSLEILGFRAPVVGVAEDPGFPGGGIDMWAPLELGGLSSSRTAHNWRVVGRMASGVSIGQARQEAISLTARLVQDEPGADPDFLATSVFVTPLQEAIVGDSRTPLLLLFGAAGLVLLVACTNLASTLLARGAARSRELAVRMSLGAAKGRILRQLLTEGLVIAGVGGTTGVLMAGGVMRGLRAAQAGTIPRLSEVTIDGWVLAYTAAVALTTAFLFGLLPALRLTRRDAGDALRVGSRGNAREGRAGVWRVLVGAEVAMAFVLLVATGLLVRSSRALLTEDIGAEVGDVSTAAVTLSLVKYASEYDQARWYDELISELEALPDVESAGVMSTLPVAGSLASGRLELDGDLERATTAGYVVASGGAFEALDIPLLRGRLFDERDTPESGHVAIVSQSFAETVWPGEDPIGHEVNGGGMDNFWEDRTFARVVGVVGDVRYRGLDIEARPTVYFAHSQRPFRLQWGASVVAESSLGDAARVVGGLRETIRRLDSDVPLRLETMRSRVIESIAERGFVMVLFGAFSLIALVLASVGIYGVVSYGVARRTREMGIRIALGADGGKVLGMVVGASMRMVFAGLALGLVAAYGLTRLLAGLLYEVSPTDPLTLVIVAVALAGTALLASWVPARAGTRVDPMVTMRAE
ncbi:MAG: ABC transporter permease [Gemmatimonadota bacterium]